MDISIIKAAKIDGASSFRILIKIILPSLASVLLLVVILTSCSAFQIYIEISLITKGGPAMSTFMHNPDGSYTDFINKRITELNLSPRKDAVVMNSFVVGADKAFFDGLSKISQYNFFSDSILWFMVFLHMTH